MRRTFAVLTVLLAVLICVPAHGQAAYKLLNDGPNASQYDVVILHPTTANAFTTTTTANHAKVLGVLAEDVANGASGVVLLPGSVATVLVKGSVTQADFLVTSTTAGAVEAAGSSISGVIALAFDDATDGNTVRCMIMGPTVLGASSDLTVNNLQVNGTLDVVGVSTVAALGGTTLTASVGIIAPQIGPSGDGDLLSMIADAATINGAFTIAGAAGANFDPVGDVDVDLLTVDVTDAPRFWWDEDPGVFASTVGLNIVGASDIDGAFTAGSVTSDAGVAGTTGIFSGNVTSGDGADAQAISIAGGAGFTRTLQFLTGVSPRWKLLADATAEGGANAGSDLYLKAFNDAGGDIGDALIITRSTMASTFGAAVDVVGAFTAGSVASDGAVSGTTGDFTSTLSVLNQGGASAARIGHGTTTDQTASLVFVSDTTDSTYGLKLIRWANKASEIQHAGTAGFNISCMGEAQLGLRTQNIARLTIASGGAVDVVNAFTAGSIASDAGVSGTTGAFTGNVAITKADPMFTLTGVADAYPKIQMYAPAHDDIHLLFDAYYDGGYKSSDVCSNFRISKASDYLSFQTKFGIIPGDATDFSTGYLRLTALGNTEASGNLGVGGTLDVVGITTLGLSANGTIFAADGRQTMTGTARSMATVVIPADYLKLPGIRDPQSTYVGFTPVLRFDQSTEEEVFAIFGIPENYDVGTDLKVHYHWAPIGAGAGDVVWGLDWYASTSNDGDLISTPGIGATVATVTDSTTSTLNEHLETALMTISGTGLSPDDLLHFRIYRKAADGTDTYAADASFVSGHISYMMDKIGADTQW